jgi:hypothetical protein
MQADMLQGLGQQVAGQLIVAWFPGTMQVVQLKSLSRIDPDFSTQCLIERRHVPRTTRWEVYHGCI